MTDPEFKEEMKLREYANKVSQKEFNFKNEIRKIPINSREEQIISLVEENFDEAVKRLKIEMTITPDENIKSYDLTAEEITEANHKAIDKFAEGKQK